LPAAATTAKQSVQGQLTKEQQEGRQLQRRLDSAEQANEQSKRQLWELEKTRADLAGQNDKLRADAEFMEGEMAGLKERAAAQAEQVPAQQRLLCSRSSWQGCNCRTDLLAAAAAVTAGTAVFNEHGSCSAALPL
jgi:chromosome segregation ATPase